MSPGEPIEFDFSNQPPRHEPPAPGEDAPRQQPSGPMPDLQPIPPATGIVADGPEGPDRGPARAAQEPVAPAVGQAPGGAPIADFRTRSYPFAVTSRFQQGGFSDPRATPRASQGRRLTWGILAALGAVLFAASVIVLMQVLDRSMHG